MRAGLWPLTAILLLLMNPAVAGGLRDVQDSWLLEATESARLLRGQAGGGLGGWNLEVMQGRLFGMEELEQQGVRIGWRARREGSLELGLLRHQTGGELFRTSGLEIQGRLGRHPRLGLVYRQRAAGSTAGDWPTWQRICWTVGFTRSLAGGNAAGCLEIPLTEADEGAITEGREDFGRLSWRRDGLALVWQVERDETGRPCSGWAVEMALGGGLGVGLRGDWESGALGSQISLLKGIFLLRTSHLAHPRLGLTHRFALGMVRP